MGEVQSYNHLALKNAIQFEYQIVKFAEKIYMVFFYCDISLIKHFSFELNYIYIGIRYILNRIDRFIRFVH